MACTFKVQKPTIIRFAKSAIVGFQGQTFGCPTHQPSQLIANDHEVRTKLLVTLEEVQQPEVGRQKAASHKKLAGQQITTARLLRETGIFKKRYYVAVINSTGRLLHVN